VAIDGVDERLNALLRRNAIDPLEAHVAAKFATYLSLILRWNMRLNLTSLRTEDAIISRHLVESVACAKAIPSGVRTLLDFGSGAGLPGIPIALCRPEVVVTLAESQGKKAAFLQEAARALGLSVKVHAGRAENLPMVFDCVVLRAVDKMAKAVAAGAKLVGSAGWLALMTTNADLMNLQAAAGGHFDWTAKIDLAESTDRVVALGQNHADDRC
jgi:16S rRNA (guanine527-N7)-methyltransferase